MLHRLGVRSLEVRDDAALVVSELVSNAVQHGAAPIVVTMTEDGADLVISVSDGGFPPYLFGSLPPDPTASRGRGLAIVARLTTRWGIQSLRPGPGKAVWCVLGDVVGEHAPVAAFATDSS